MASRTVVAILGVLLVATAGLAGSLYLQNLNDSSSINSKNNSLTTQSEVISSLEGNLSTLNTNISSLSDQISILQTDNSTSETQIQALHSQLTQLEDQSAVLRQEITLLGQVTPLGEVGTVERISAYAANQTLTVEPNQTVLLDEEVNEYNGSLVFFGYACPNTGTSSNTGGEPGITILLNSKGSGAAFELVLPIGDPQQWSVHLTNVGPISVQCTASLYYVYQTSANSP